MTKACASFLLVLCWVISGLCVVSSAAHANAWEEFEQRCLVPMENVSLVLPSDLTPIAQFKNDGDPYNEYDVGSGVKLWVSYGDAGAPQWCHVILPSSSPETGRSFLAWSERAVELRRYEELAAPRGDRMILRSTEWREPRMDVRVIVPHHLGGLTLSAMETELES
jgi:hypothetical protein